MAERELFVICSNCSSEVSPYVTECPYCGQRLRKRAPDIKKAKKQEEKHARKEEKRANRKREKIRAQYEGGGTAAYLYSPAQPRMTIALVVVAIVSSLLAKAGFSEISEFMDLHLAYYEGGENGLWTFVTTPFLQYWPGYGFVCLGVFAMFGSGIERRFGWWAVLLVWLIGGAFGVAAEALIAPTASTFGAYGAAACAFVTWMIVVLAQEDLRDKDAYGLMAVAGVLCALPLATDAASAWTLIGGIVGGGICGGVLSRVNAKPVY